MNLDHTTQAYKNGSNSAQGTAKKYSTPGLKNTQNACEHGNIQKGIQRARMKYYTKKTEPIPNSNMQAQKNIEMKEIQNNA